MDYMTVFGCTPQKHTRTDWKDYWKLEYATDDQMLFMSKELYNYNSPEENRIFDFKNHHRNLINQILHGLEYDYVYDGEEM